LRIEDFAARLVRDGDNYKCPAHADENGSLAVNDGGDKILLHCFAGCTPDEIVSSVGLTMRDLYSDGKPSPRTLKENSVDLAAFFAKAHAHINDTDYPARRGLSIETLNRFNLGFVQDWVHPKAQNAPPSPRLIIPTSRTSYLARDTRTYLTEKQAKYSKSKVGTTSVFNVDALWTSDKPVFIVEAEIDSMSICEVGGEAVGLGSTSMVKRLFGTVKKKLPVQPLIIALDNDRAGHEAAEKLSTGLKLLGIQHAILNVYGDHKDANEALCADRDTFAAAVKAAEQMEFAELEKPTADDILADVDSDTTNAQIFLDACNGDIVFVPEMGFALYDGILWIFDDKSNCRVRAKIIEIATLKMTGGVYGTARRFVEWLAVPVQNRMITALQGLCFRSIKDFDKNWDLINFDNGTYDLSTMTFREHRRDDYITQTTHCDYDMNAEFPRWNQFQLELSDDDTELMLYRQVVSGYAISGRATEDCGFLCYGATTGNGKSTEAKAIAGAMGDYAATLNVESLCDSKFGDGDGSKPSPDIARLRGKRRVDLSEPTRGALLNAKRWKSLTGRDKQLARHLHKEFFEFEFRGVMFMLCNNLPSVNDLTLFKSERLRVIPYNAQFRNTDKQDRTLDTQFSTPQAKSAVWNWLLMGFEAYLGFNGKGIPNAKAVEVATKAYGVTSDKIYRFLDEGDYKNRTVNISIKNLYGTYQSWCLENGVMSEKLSFFTERLKDLCGAGRVDRAKDADTGQLVMCLKGVKHKDTTQNDENDENYTYFLKNSIIQK